MSVAALAVPGAIATGRFLATMAAALGARFVFAALVIIPTPAAAFALLSATAGAAESLSRSPLRSATL